MPKFTYLVKYWSCFAFRRAGERQSRFIDEGTRTGRGCSPCSCRALWAPELGCPSHWPYTLLLSCVHMGCSRGNCVLSQRLQKRRVDTWWKNTLKLGCQTHYFKRRMWRDLSPIIYRLTTLRNATNERSSVYIKDLVYSASSKTAKGLFLY